MYLAASPSFSALALSLVGVIELMCRPIALVEASLVASAAGADVACAGGFGIRQPSGRKDISANEGHLIWPNLCEREEVAKLHVFWTILAVVTFAGGRVHVAAMVRGECDQVVGSPLFSDGSRQHLPRLDVVFESTGCQLGKWTRTM